MTAAGELSPRAFLLPRSVTDHPQGSAVAYPFAIADVPPILSRMSARPGVLMTADESPASLAAARGLTAGGYRVHVAVTRVDTYVAHSRSPASVERLDQADNDPQAFADALATVSERLGVSLVLPTTEATLRALTGRERQFGPGVSVGTCSSEALEAATDKLTFQRLAAEEGLETISTVEVNGGTVGEAAAALSFPAIIKPQRTVAESDGRLASTDVETIETMDELRAILDEDPRRSWLVQPYVNGTLAAIGGVCWRGELVCATHQLSPRIWPPERGITAYGLTVPADPHREEAIARMLSKIGWSGIFGVQFLLANGHAYAIDLNPRVYGSIGLAIAAGQNLPAIWADLLAGVDPVVRPYRVGVRYRVEEDDFRALAAAFANGRRREALTGLLPRRRTAHAVFSIRDPLPSVRSVAKVFERAAARDR